MAANKFVIGLFKGYREWGQGRRKGAMQTDCGVNLASMRFREAIMDAIDLLMTAATVKANTDVKKLPATAKSLVLRTDFSDSPTWEQICIAIQQPQTEDMYHDPGRTFRVIPSEMWGVENNLSLSNMDFFEFADAADEDGVFRGF
jgi:hypothetical protein